MLWHIRHSVTACQGLEVMHSPDAHQFQSNQILLIHAIHHHAVKIQFVIQTMVLPNVAAFHRILEMHTELDVGQSVFSTQIVPVEWHVYDSIAEIHVQVSAVHLHNATSLIMCQCALAKEAIKVIHSSAVEKFQ